MTLKFQNDIVKNKWQMTIQVSFVELYFFFLFVFSSFFVWFFFIWATQMLERKSMRKKLTFYNLLLQVKLFSLPCIVCVNIYFNFLYSLLHFVPIV